MTEFLHIKMYHAIVLIRKHIADHADLISGDAVLSPKLS